MADITHELPLPAERPPPRTHGVIPWLRANLFGSVFNTILTLVALYILAVTVPPLIRWTLIDAIWTAPNGQACRSDGASPPLIPHHLRLTPPPPPPYAEQWRPLLVLV